MSREVYKVAQGEVETLRTLQSPNPDSLSASIPPMAFLVLLSLLAVVVSLQVTNGTYMPSFRSVATIDRSLSRYHSQGHLP